MLSGTVLSAPTGGVRYSETGVNRCRESTDREQGDTAPRRDVA